MDQDRLEFIKKVHTFFRQNLQATHFLGVSRSTCLAITALNLSGPTETHDPTHPDFLNQTQVKIDRFEHNFSQNVHPDVIPLPSNLEVATQTWQKEITRGLDNKTDHRDLTKRGLQYETQLNNFARQAWQKGNSKLDPKMDLFLKGVYSGNLPGRSRYEFLKEVADHFRQNPQDRQYLGVSRQACYSVLALQLSTPEEILDPTDPRFSTQINQKFNDLDKEEDEHQTLAGELRKELTSSVGEDKMGELEKTAKEKMERKDPLEAREQKMRDLLTIEDGLKKNKHLPQMGLASPELEKTIQDWQDEAAKRPPSGQIPRLKKSFDKPLKEHSMQTMQKVNPKIASKMNWFLKSGAVKALSVVGFFFMASVFSAEAIKKAVKYLAPPIYFMYNLFASLGIGALAGAVIGGTLGGLAGAIGGAFFGAKLGIVIGAAVGGPVGAVIGGIIGGITGFVIGGLAGTAIGMAIGGAVGYAVDHWVWQPIQGFWTGAGDALGGIGGGTGGALGGIGGFFGSMLGGAGSAIGGILSWAGGGITAAGGFVAGLGAELSTISLPASAVTVPVLGATGGAFALTLWVNTSIIGTAFMREPIPKEYAPPPTSIYIALEKTASPAFLTNTDVGGGGKDISYTIKIGAPKGPITNVRLTDQTTKVTNGVSTIITTGKENITIGSISQGATETITYQIRADGTFKDSVITNDVTVTAETPGKAGEMSTASFTVIIGSVSCLVANGDFSREAIIRAANTLSAFYGIDPFLTKAIIQVETGFSGTNWRDGVMQVIPGTKEAIIQRMEEGEKRYILELACSSNFTDTSQAIRELFSQNFAVQVALGTRYLSERVSAASGNKPLGMLGYNCPGCVSWMIERYNGNIDQASQPYLLPTGRIAYTTVIRVDPATGASYTYYKAWDKNDPQQLEIYYFQYLRQVGTRGPGAWDYYNDPAWRGGVQ